ncbi:Protein of unknown function [Pseudidiomarina planktonica]|uniref:DUF3545 domain-containing protein n=1 Tax=Pseudidiomarina planktonica TaxID=1323738 RepID=A0A1Y6EJK5_9GAMM|nr:DUF3545 family protein [Pseudidiomarina planktonica]RUO65979.1 DUF3545 domain-containing protein [Pseudidiomarina planktonica]SMQ61361.1 Protein of unknown function [Pseudidiomarina planktonica]
MDHSEELSVVNDKSDKSRNSKRKWREIEAIKEKYRLRQELQEMDFGLDVDLEEMDF